MADTVGERALRPGAGIGFAWLAQDGLPCPHHRNAKARHSLRGSNVVILNDVSIHPTGLLEREHLHTRGTLSAGSSCEMTERKVHQSMMKLMVFAAVCLALSACEKRMPGDSSYDPKPPIVERLP